MVLGMNQVENWDFEEKTVPQWRSRSEVSYGSLKTPKTAFPDQKIAKIIENPENPKIPKNRIFFPYFPGVGGMGGAP